MNGNYRIEGMDILLCEDCVLARYAPLIAYKTRLIENLKKLGCETRDDCLALTDADLRKVGLPDVQTAALFRAFLRLYDYKGRGVRDIPDAQGKTQAEIAALLELMPLPGVKALRAGLYYRCGYRTLRDLAEAEPQQMRCTIGETIEREALSVSTPFLKELRTQIAVAKVFTQYAAQ